MNRRLVLIIGVVVAIALGGYVVFDVGNRDRPLPGPNGNPATNDGSSPDLSASVAAVASPAGSPSASAPSPGATAGPLASCVVEPRLVAMKATAPATGFPIPVKWTNLGPAGDLFFTLSDLTPTIPLAPAGPASLIVGLSYMTGGDRFAFTASSVTLAYDPATGLLSGDVATGYGKNSNRATTDAQPSRFEGTLTRPTGGTNGVLVGSIAHHARTFAFRMEMTEKTIQVASGPGCTSTSPTDAPLAP